MGATEKVTRFPSEAPARPRAALPIEAVRLLVRFCLDELADALIDRLHAHAERTRDPNWGWVSQRTLPAWIHPDAYVEACRAGKIEGARLWRRQWLARREAVEEWWSADARSGPVEQFDDAESLDTILASNGFDRRAG